MATTYSSYPAYTLKYRTFDTARPQSYGFPNKYTKAADFDKYYTDNEDTILALISRVLNNDIRSVELDEHLKIFMEGLDRLQELYPFVSAVVTPFRTATSMHIQKGNNEKVAALQAQMLVTLFSLFRLRHVKGTGEKGMDSTFVEDRMRALVELMAQDFTKAASFCDLYTSTDPLLRMMNYQTYEKHLEDQGQLFAQRRAEILSMLNNIQIAQKERVQLEDIERKMDMVKLLRKLETRNEQAVREFVDEKGGPEACLKNDELLKGVLEKAGSTAGVTSATGDLTELRQKLSQDFSEDLDQALSKKFDSFQDQLKEQESHIMSVLRAGAHDRIVNKDMKAIWEDMSWKGSVKARHFVLALHDHFNDKMSLTRLNDLGSETDDQWTLSYINVAHVQPILEAIDDDGTGFISIKEVNDFEASRPEGWTLPHWIAYWAAGWHVSIHHYRQKIYALVQDISKLAKDVHPDNRKQVNEYLSHPTFTNLELLLRLTTPAPAAAMKDSQLIALTNSYVAAEENKLKNALEEVNYELDSSATISQVTGPGRIERFIYPLLFLVLQQHRRVVYLAQKHILNNKEFGERSKSLSSLFAVLKERADGLTSIFKQSSSDIQARLGYFAFGILQSSYGDLKRDPRNNTLLTWKPLDSTGIVQGIQEPLQSASTAILKYNTRGIVSGSVPRAETDHLCKCDGCSRDIVGSRFLCLTCMDENFSSNINLCSKCTDKPACSDRFSHYASHPLLKADDIILDSDLAWVAPKARARAQEAKDILRALNLPPDAIGPQYEYPPLTCSSCKNNVKDSCWIDLISKSSAVYYCDNCHSQGKYTQNKLGNYLVNVRYAEDALSIDMRLDRLEKRIEELYAFTDYRVEASESKNDSHRAAIEARLNCLEGKLDGCLTFLQSLSRQISGQGGVSRANSGPIRMPLASPTF